MFPSKYKDLCALIKSRHASRNSLIDSNVSIARPGGEMTRQESIRFSNDSSFRVLGPMRLLILACLSSSEITRSVISNRLRLQLWTDFDRFTSPARIVSSARFRFCPDEGNGVDPGVISSAFKRRLPADCDKLWLIEF